MQRARRVKAVQEPVEEEGKKIGGKKIFKTNRNDLKRNLERTALDRGADDDIQTKLPKKNTRRPQKISDRLLCCFVLLRGEAPDICLAQPNGLGYKPNQTQ